MMATAQKRKSPLVGGLSLLTGIGLISASISGVSELTRTVFDLYICMISRSRVKPVLNLVKHLIG